MYALEISICICTCSEYCIIFHSVNNTQFFKTYSFVDGYLDRFTQEYKESGKKTFTIAFILCNFKKMEFLKINIWK